ncbi:DinB family protein [Algisphaera agarilytica]|nr:DinB family protein [Algisphaera agarilytica]
MDFAKEITVLRFMQGYGDDLVADIEPQDMCKQPVVGMNHPAWILGHLAMAVDSHAESVGGTPQLIDWRDRFGFGTTLTTDPADYPAKSELIETWHAANDRFIAAVSSASPEDLSKPTLGPAALGLPTVGDYTSFSLTAHTALHLGQLSAWRRADGRPPLF